MTSRIFRTSAALVFGTALLASSALAQSRPAASQSAYGGNTVEEIIARINDQIISRSDYERALHDIEVEASQRGLSADQVAAARKDVLRNLIDQQLWLSKGKELGITGETELVNRLNEIRKQYNLETMEDLEKAAKEQGVSFEDFKANVRNQIVTQLVMRQQVGRKASPTPGEAERYYEAHKQEYAQPESVNLAEILVSTGTPAPSALDKSGTQPEDPAKLAAAKAKADDIYAKLTAGGDFTQLARTFSDGPTAAQGGDLGQFKRGALAKVLEDATFSLKSGEFTKPVRTKQGYVVFKVSQHIQGGVPAYKDVQEQVQEALYMARMEPAIRDYLTEMRDQAYLDIKPGYVDSGASPNKNVYPISYSAYTAPSAKKKRKVERTRFRETNHTFRQKGPAPTIEAVGATVAGVKQDAAAAPTDKKSAKEAAKAAAKAKKEAVKNSIMKPGKKEKIRFGQAPTQTLPNADTKVDDAGAGDSTTATSTAEVENPLDTKAKPAKKTRFAAKAAEMKKEKQATKAQGPKVDALAPVAADSAEVADRQVQNAALGLKKQEEAKKKKQQTTTGDKTRLQDKNKKPEGDAATEQK